jgi:hypothetical protein
MFSGDAADAEDIEVFHRGAFWFFQCDWFSELPEIFNVLLIYSKY